MPINPIITQHTRCKEYGQHGFITYDLYDLTVKPSLSESLLMIPTDWNDPELVQ